MEMVVIWLAVIIAAMSCYYFLQTVVQNGEAAERRMIESFASFLERFQIAPLDEDLHAEFRDFYWHLPKKEGDALGERFYQLALHAVANHPQSVLIRPFALEVGRWHKGRLRPDGNVTIYDEQALQNDIVVRTK